MKVYMVAILLLSLASALDLKTQIGQECSSTGSISIALFDVRPWPPSTYISSFVNLTFVINQPNTSVGVITYGILNQLQQWTYQFQVVNQQFPQYSVESLEYILLWPTTPGNYITQVTIGSFSAPTTINACWIFSFLIPT
ncbi:hypothetical protein SteCoe_2269 [Stentor coeruleus]|uniref:MD-2-related lipid-recognition domain-containing protein n=1 Tax=Stentor coeruleus TaxID=5963 RepID=A0A1R2CZR2_9CILI|nr:hypothetical protein SteCoe_2269 [Stentor coeruleus]